MLYVVSMHTTSIVVGLARVLDITDLFHQISHNNLGHLHHGIHQGL